MATRRTVLLQGCAIGAGVIASRLTGAAALAQSQKPLRRSLGDLPLNDPILEAWREGVDRLKRVNPTERISWASFAAIHGTRAGFNRCPHGNWYFLPWHRGFLLMYEKTVRELTGHADFALPYWDWSANRQLPTAFAQPTWNGRPNPLFQSGRTVTPTDSLSDEIVGPAVMSNILNQPAYEIFGTSRPRGQNSLDQSWIGRRTGDKGELEANPHDLIHGFVGGVMGGSQSALDPIFMMHHCNIDRIWAVWNAPPFNNANSTDPLWTGMMFNEHFFNPDGSAYSPKVSELFSPETLGYTYGLPGAPATARPPAVVALGKNLESLVATPEAKNLANVKTFAAQNAAGATASPSRPLEIPVDVDRSLMTEVARRRIVRPGDLALESTMARAEAAAGMRALAFIRDIDFTAHENTIYRVFIDCAYLSNTTPISDPHYVGSFGQFGDHEGHGAEADRPSIVLDLTSAIKRVYGDATELSGRLSVQIMPVPLKPSAGPAGTAAPKSVEVAFVSS